MASHGGNIQADSGDFARGVSFFLLREECCPSRGILPSVQDCQSAAVENKTVDVVSWDFAPCLVRGGGDIEGVWVFSGQEVPRISVGGCGAPFVQLPDVNVAFYACKEALLGCPIEDCPMCESWSVGCNLLAPCALVGG